MKRRIEESIISGGSLAETQLSTLMNNNYNIVCGIVVQNWTNMELSLPCVNVNTGSISKPPASVSPGQREAVVITLFHVCDIDMLVSRLNALNTINLNLAMGLDLLHIQNVSYFCKTIGLFSKRLLVNGNPFVLHE